MPQQYTISTINNTVNVTFETSVYDEETLDAIRQIDESSKALTDALVEEWEAARKPLVEAQVAATKRLADLDELHNSNLQTVRSAAWDARRAVTNPEPDEDADGS